MSRRASEAIEIFYDALNGKIPATGPEMVAARKRLQELVDNEPPLSYAFGDRVVVNDPIFGRKKGRVVYAHDDGSLYIEGPRIDAVRVFAWSIEGDLVDRYVSRAS